jgi:hypothetical protein
MKLIEVTWTPRVNVLWVRCDCGYLFAHPANIAMARCPACHATQLWHIAEPQIPGTPFSGPCMEYALDAQLRLW